MRDFCCCIRLLSWQRSYPDFCIKAEPLKKYLRMQVKPVHTRKLPQVTLQSMLSLPEHKQAHHGRQTPKKQTASIILITGLIRSTTKRGCRHWQTTQRG